VSSAERHSQEPPTTATRLGRLARSGEIRQVLRGGRSYGCAAGNMRIRDGASTEHRLCVIASRQVGKAIVRNRVRRAVREILRRELRPDAEPIDVVFRVKPGADALGFWDFHAALMTVLRRARLEAPPCDTRWGAMESGGPAG
jgi:ribonuclease P protein component